MLIRDRMSKPVITVPDDMPILDVLKLMQTENIRRVPVMRRGKMVGIISDKDVLNAAPSDATTLSVWEVNYLVSKIKVSDIMTRDVITIDSTTPLEEAARIMADHKIGGIPVVDHGEVVGLITETDLFRILLELMGARESGVRATAIVPDERGRLAKITQAVADAGGSFLSFGQYAGDATDTRMVTFKVRNLPIEAVRSLLEPHVERVTDVRMVEGD